MARIERPLSLALCTAFHLAIYRGVDFLRGEAVDFPTLPLRLCLAP